MQAERVSSSNGSGRIEDKGEERGDAGKRECHEIIPRELFFEERDGEDDEDDERNNLLNDFELEAGELAMAEARAAAGLLPSPPSDAPRALA